MKKERTYKIHLMEFDGVYYPANHIVTVKANTLDEAIKKAISNYECDIDDDEVEWAKERLEDDGYDIMLGTRSNEYRAVMYNNILDVGRNSHYRLLKGYCGKRKCFDIILKLEE